MPESKPKVVVVGAGVTGLTSGLLLLKNGYDVSIIAKHIPGDFELLSSKAGAQWSSHSGPDEFTFQEYDKPGYYEFLKLAREEPTSGIHEVLVDHYAHKDYVSAYKLPWFESYVPGFQKLDRSNFKFPSDDLVKGHRYKSVTITTPHYLAYLYAKVIEFGGTIKRARIDHINDANKYHHSGETPDLIINATALGARFLGGVNDLKMYPVKGHIVVVSNSCYNQKIVQPVPGSEVPGEAFYIMNRKEGGSIIGGCYHPVKIDEMDFKIDDKLTQRILTRAKKYAPELLDSKAFPENKPELDIVTVYVAYRPTREGGIRLEREGKIIHNYGAGGTGYQSSFGTAAGVLKLANEYIAKTKGSKL
ncbi:hypothetical protein DASC09_015570 [Saccharomycopsis crataegensis]|uniref:FAD dependent oxidoreductase domain-containing protein n=1 Tax=Saccharomycopsis crataegensis TaxID=43959 RepID=A0AAV5QI22_9ASCO|nr:hypothetical protein DASC09_015570 [Saccharomycopsis crataegensis]